MCGSGMDHEVLWNQFVAEHGLKSRGGKENCIRGLEDVPFPSFVEQEASEAPDRQKYLRRLVLRWHPDKFIQRFGAGLVDEDIRFQAYLNCA